MKLFNIVLFRTFKNCNYDVIKAWYERNRKQIEENFYQNDILMSGVIKEREGEVLEILYLKYHAREKIEWDHILQIYSIGKKSFPTYDEFIKFINENRDKDIVNSILRKIMQTSLCEEWNEMEYSFECSKVQKLMKMPFVDMVTSKSSLIGRKEIELDEIKRNELAFIGIVSASEANTFKEMLIYKILEKLFGSNDKNGIYSEFRECGWIYTGLSGFIIEKNFFYSGVIMQYSKKHEEKIIQKIKNVHFTEREFDNAKTLVLDDYKYSIFQYGMEFTLLPYRLHTEMTVDFTTCLNMIEIKDVVQKLEHVQINEQQLRLRVM